MNTTPDNAQGLRALVRLFTNGYKSGHHDTVEGQFTDVYQSDLETYFEDQVREILTEPEYAALATHPPQQERAAPWRSMESAPRDGTIVFGMLPDSNVAHAVFYGDKHRKQDGFRVCWRVAWDGAHLSEHSEPIAWMPIPDLAAAPAAPATPESAAPVALPEVPDPTAELVNLGLPGEGYEIWTRNADYTEEDMRSYGEACAIARTRPTPAASDGGLREALCEMIPRWRGAATGWKEAGHLTIFQAYADAADELEAVLDRALVMAGAAPPTEQAKPSKACAHEQVTEDEAEKMLLTVGDDGWVVDAYFSDGVSHAQAIKVAQAAGNALLALRAAQQKGGGQ